MGSFSTLITLLTNQSLIPTTASLPLPRSPRMLNTVNFWWEFLGGTSKVDLWLQQGKEVNPLDSPGNYIITHFQLAASASKATQTNTEFLCTEIPPGMKTLVLQIKAGSATTALTTAFLEFQD